MFSIRVKIAPVFVNSYDNGQVSEAFDCTLIYNGHIFQFIEQNGLYSYANFFEDDDFPEQCYENGELHERYQDSIFLNMISGGWDESLTNLLQTINFLNMSIDEDEEDILDFITRLKNGEGVRRVLYEGEEEMVYDEIMLKNYEGDEVDVDWHAEIRRMQGYYEENDD
jgi:hypothetical protein